MKKKSVWVARVSILFFILALLLSGCSGNQGSPGSEDRKAGSGKVTGGSEWPDWVPSIVPEYKYGSVFSSLKQEEGGALIFVNVEMNRDPYGSYKKELLDKGWKVEEESETDQAKHLHVKQNGYWLTYAFPTDGEGVSIYYGGDDRDRGQTSDDPAVGQISEGPAGGQIARTYDLPSGFPDHVPLLDGDIISAGRDETDERIIYYVVFENIKDAGVDSYEKQLKAMGWNVFLKQEMGDTWMLQARHEDQGDILATANEEEKRGSINFGLDK